jgi:hypothetical protein
VGDVPPSAQPTDSPLGLARVGDSEYVTRFIRDKTIRPCIPDDRLRSLVFGWLFFRSSLVDRERLWPLKDYTALEIWRGYMRSKSAALARATARLVGTVRGTTEICGRDRPGFHGSRHRWCSAQSTDGRRCGCCLGLRYQGKRPGPGPTLPRMAGAHYRRIPPGSFSARFYQGGGVVCGAPRLGPTHKTQKTLFPLT